MISRIIITPAAELDLAESRDWYDAIRPGLAHDFELALEAVLDRITCHPQAYELAGHGLRRALLPRFSHAVFYREVPSIIQVVAVLHTSRAPRAWQSRTH